MPEWQREIFFGFWFPMLRLFLLSERLANPAYFVVAGAQHGQAGAELQLSPTFWLL